MTGASADRTPGPDMDEMRARLEALSSAEDLFAFFDVAYEQRVLDVARLHILKRLNQYLADPALEPLAGDELFQAIRSRLERAYEDFVRSSPREQGVFEVLERRAREARGFVALDELRPPTQ